MSTLSSTIPGGVARSGGVSDAMRDSATMVRRNFRHTLRYPGTLVMSLGVPSLLLLLFVGVFGGALTAGIGSEAHGAAYVDYLVPGILLMTIGYGSSSTATAVNTDMTEGIIARFRTMAISRSSVLTGHVVGALVRTMISLVLVVGLALLMGFRSSATPSHWLATVGLVTLLALALTWPAAAIGLLARTAQGTAPFVLIVQTLPFTSSAFVSTASMPSGVRWFAQHEPFTPIIDTIRGLLVGTPIGQEWIAAVVWCLALALGGYLVATALFRRDPSR